MEIGGARRGCGGGGETGRADDTRLIGRSVLVHRVGVVGGAWRQAREAHALRTCAGDRDAAAVAAAAPVCIWPALTCAALGAVALVLTTTYMVPLASFVVAPPVPVVDPVWVPVGLDRLAAPAACRARREARTAHDRRSLLLAASRCWKWNQYVVLGVRLVALNVLAPVVVMAWLPEPPGAEAPV